MHIFYNKYMNLMAINRVAFTLFGYDIYWYGVIIACAILVAYLVSLLLVKIRHLDMDLPFEILIFAIPLGIVFARLAAVLFDSGLSITDYFNFRSGGMSIIGAIFGGFIGILLLKLIKKRSILECIDIIATVVILSQGIGRWGNFFNSEIYGQIVTNPNLQFFPYAVFIESEGAFFEALFFYEFVLDVLGFVGLFFIFKHVKIKGVAAASYLMYYGTIRIILETRRATKYVLTVFGLPFSIISSVVMIVAGGCLLTYVLIKYYKDKKMERSHGG